MYRMHTARVSSRMLVSAAPPKQSFLLFCWPAREMGALPRPCRLALRVTAKQFLAAPILAQRDITRALLSHIPNVARIRSRRRSNAPRPVAVQSDYGWDFGASEATIFSKRGSPRNGSQNGSSFNSP